MSEGSISQAEIDALLSDVDMGGLATELLLQQPPGPNLMWRPSRISRTA